MEPEQNWVGYIIVGVFLQFDGHFFVLTYHRVIEGTP